MNTIQRFEKALDQLETQLNEANKKGVSLEKVTKQKQNSNWDKIQYWQRELNTHVINRNIRLMDTAHRKLDYYIGKQWDLEFVVDKTK